MKYIRTKDGVYEYKNNKVFKYITKEIIVDAGYGKELPKGSFVKIGETWNNYYGRWTSIIDENGNIYDIRPNRVEEVIEEIKYKEADTIEELCDQIVYNGYLYQTTLLNNCLIEDSFEELDESITDEMIKEGIYGAIWTKWGLKYVAKMNNKKELELI